MRNIHTVDALRSVLQINKNIELISDWDCDERSTITCKCFCGNIFTRSPRYIMSYSNPCGCIKRKLKIESVTKLLKDTKNLEVISTINEWRGCNTDIVKLKCFCGNIFERRVNNIKYRANSCGCLMYQYDSGNKSYKWKGSGELSAHMFYRMKSGALCRNIEFTITQDEAWNLYLHQNKKMCINRD